MIFQSNTYSVLLVSAKEKLNTAILPLLPSTDFWPVATAQSVNQARRMTLESDFDLVLVNSPLPDGSGVQFCADLCATRESSVLLIVKKDLYEEIYYKVLSDGVVTLPRPTAMEVVAQTLRVLCAMRERMRAAQKKQMSVEEKMEELRLFNQAKWRLINDQGMTEEEAHRYILAQAMERRVKKAELAQMILQDKL